jgi:hypothetical protein
LNWRKNKTPSIITDKVTCAQQEGYDEAAAKYVVDFNIYEKSSYFDLDSATISAVANSVLVVKVVTEGLVSAAPAAAPAKGAKAAPAAAPVVSDIVLAEVKISLSELLSSNESAISSPSSFSSSAGITFSSIAEALDATRSSISFRVSGDNDFAEFIAGGALMQWDSARISGLSRAWGLHMAEEPPGKPSKVPPTEAELKAKYLDSLSTVINNQKDISSFTISLRATNPSTLKFPDVTSWTGIMKFDQAATESLSLEAVKNRSDLWTVEWQTPSPKTFFDRTVARNLLSVLEGRDEQDCSVVVEVRKTPSASAAALEGGEQRAAGSVLVADLANAGVSALDGIVVSLQDSSSSENSPQLSLKLTLSRPLRDETPKLSKSGIRPADMSSLHQVGGGASNRDVFKELRDEISAVIKEIAAEYVSLYPSPPSGKETADAAELQARKAHFFHHLTSSGVYHRLKESLKPRIQRAARKRYGARSRALGLAGSASFDSMALGAETELPLDQLLGELYVFLVQESNSVLNAMYRETVVDCDLKEIEQPPAIDDETESPKQLFKRLLSLAFDAESSGDFFKAEQRHLERIQLLSIEKSLHGDFALTRNAYSKYASFLLHRAAVERRQKSDDAARTSLANAREALVTALSANTDDATSDSELQLELGCLLLESGLHEEAIEYFNKSISSQLVNADSTALSDDFDGYQTERLSPVNPLCYVFLTLYFLEMKKPLSARKATRLVLK